MTMGDGFFDCASVFPKSVTELMYCTLHLEHCIIYMRLEDEQEM